jgi:hypothetical protein
LDHERRAEEQVPLLLQMKEDKIALVKAIDSGDTDLGAFVEMATLTASIPCAAPPPNETLAWRLFPYRR